MRSEDDLPEGVEYVGNTIAELLERGYGAQKTAYWIRCPECVEYIKQTPRCLRSDGAFKADYGRHTPIIIEEPPVKLRKVKAEPPQVEPKVDADRFAHLSKHSRDLRNSIEAMVSREDTSIRQIVKEVNKLSHVTNLSQTSVRDFVFQGIVPSNGLRSLEMWYKTKVTVTL